MTVDDLKNDITKGNKNINDDNDIVYGRPREDWLLTSLIQNDNSAINAVLNSPVRKAKIKHWSDRIKCNVCGIEYIRSNQSAHKRTRVHQAYQDMNDRVRDLLLNK